MIADRIELILWRRYYQDMVRYFTLGFMPQDEFERRLGYMGFTQWEAKAELALIASTQKGTLHSLEDELEKELPKIESTT